jgi:DNA mismatch endonuclease (patch repair protein)
MLAGMGIKGWRKNAEDLPGKPDVAFVEKHVAVFVDGCFWHGCPHCNRKLPKTNQEYWERKIQRNIDLARSYNSQLQQDGWIVVRVWEHEMKEFSQVRHRIHQALNLQQESINHDEVGRDQR